MASILNSVKRYIGIPIDYDVFDEDNLIDNINSSFSYLSQIGCGPKEGFEIEDADDDWSSYTSDKKLLGFVRLYVKYKAKIIFDPPQSGPLMSALKEEIKELESRINYYVDPEGQNESN